MNCTDIKALKSDLRRTMIERLRLTTETQRAAWSRTIFHWLTHDDSWAQAGGVVAIFGGIKTEPDLLPLLPWLRAREVRAALFAIEGEKMTPYVVRSNDDIVAGRMGVLEPKRGHGERLDISEFTSVLVPGLAFGKNDGSRLGRGKGFYDQILGAVASDVRTVGVCFDLQLVPDVPTEDHDVPLHALVSESGWIEVD